jgi:hypothetical protein
LKREALHVLRNTSKQNNSLTLNIQKKLALYFTIFLSKSILVISSNKNCSKSHCVKRDFPNYMLLKIEILLIPLLAKNHIFEISEDDHPIDELQTSLMLPIPRV